ncbi:hypothetical protein JAO76_17985 [Pontibacter sp. BT310]|uniref:YncE family protein n=1 Tax=Pontibacter populi TaxID=890055 RepID=A0ABS6XG46_9BACT|nr:MULTISPECIES: hypothetical protein [Pontibacter]MBJ6120100.1 hypothetical protein [Pontibacter sp. BT310]MBR0572533.1 hypothetical protein [Microvirga sp. STS03]MBW3366953.1 hypothetical protein [Pontibacter populi]
MHKFGTSIIGAFALAGSLMACNDLMVHDEQMTPLNLTYPAAFVVNGLDNTVAVIRLSENQLSETIKLQDAVAPHHISISPDKTTLAVAITSTDLSGGHDGMDESDKSTKVIILDAVTGLVKQTLLLPSMPHNAAFNAAGNELWIGQQNENSGTVLVFDTGDWSIKSVITVGKNPSEVTFATDGNLAFVANTGDASVSVIDPSSKTVLKTLQVGKDPVGAWPATDGNMYVDNESAKTVSIINVASTTVTETLALGFKPGYVAYQEDSKELWVSNATDGKVVVYQRVGDSWIKKAEVATGADAHAIAFNSDKSLAYITNQGAGTVTVLDATTYTKVKELAIGRMPNGIVIKP